MMIKRIYLSLSVLAVLLVSSFGVYGVVYADTATDLQAACAQANNEPAYCASLNQRENPVTGSDGIIGKITNVIALAAGFVAVIMVIYGGFRYIISNGDPAKITAARQTITYALVGLVVLVLARSIIIFVLNRVA